MLVNRIKPIVSRKDTVCYKLVILGRHSDPDTYYTITQHAKLTHKDHIIGYTQLNGKLPRCARTKKNLGLEYGITADKTCTRYWVNRGVYSMSSLRHAIECAWDSIYHSYGLIRIFKCIIPKGTNYWKDMEGDVYMSDRIVYLEEVPQERWFSCVNSIKNNTRRRHIERVKKHKSKHICN